MLGRMKSLRTMGTRTYLLLGLLVLAIAGAARWYWPASPEPPRAARVNMKPPLPMLGIDPKLVSLDDPEPDFTGARSLTSQLCTKAQFDTERLTHWATELHEHKRYHCKLWEYAFILQALEERGALTTGKQGLGFGVGQEPLPSLFAKYGAAVVATDLDLQEATKEGWAKTGQHMTSLKVLNQRKLVSDDVFTRLVSTRNVDMNRIPEDLRGFDFTWSTCALGHIGGLEKGLAFIENSLATLKPGGVAVHTTEYNLSSDVETLVTDGTSVYRRHDIQELVRRLTAAGHDVQVSFNSGSDELDQHVDERPYSENVHLKIRLDRYVVTSLGLIIRKKLD